jgi:hypothetical protein
MFEGLGEGMVKDSVKSAMHSGLGAIGGALGIHGNGNPTGKVGDPFHVIVAGGAVARPGGAAVPLAAGNNSGGIGGFFKALFGGKSPNAAGSVAGADSGATDTASWFGGMMAEGGSVDPGKIYGIAEAGEAEWFTPRTSGTVTPAHKMGGSEIHINVDARGADIGVEGRVRSLLAGAHNSAVVTAIQTNAERAKRTPK